MRVILREVLALGKEDNLKNTHTHRAGEGKNNNMLGKYYGPSI